MNSKLQWTAFAVLASVSTFFTALLAINLGSDATEKTALIVGSLAIEALKLYCLINANARKRGFLLYGTYCFVALYSLFASFGYALVTVDRMASQNVILDHSQEILLEEQNLSLMNDAITNLQQGIKDKRDAQVLVPTERLTRKLEIQKLISEDQAKIESYITKKAEIQTKLNSLRADNKQLRNGRKRTMYDLIGSTLGVDPKWVAFWILAVFAISIELGIFVTSPHRALEPEPEVKVRKPRKVKEKKEVPEPETLPETLKPKRIFGRTRIQVNEE